ncbi:MAG: efflux RND transporter permease subunit, partial [Planctomycetaceae bacterium]|nr:efflux RND transporter permease subunit [Planctomycetaceae bacterium]
TSGLIIASILVYLVMVAQFNSFLDPLIVLLTVPLGFIGIVGILLLTQTHLSIMAFMGIIMTVGIVVEYSIVLVDFANRRLAEGMSVREAIVDATRIRLRPILMTSLTTWLALLPMAIGFGGGEANVPLARAIIGGVLGATVLSLVVVPCLYLVLKREPRNTPQEPGLP